MKIPLLVFACVVLAAGCTNVSPVSDEVVPPSPSSPVDEMPDAAPAVMTADASRLPVDAAADTVVDAAVEAAEDAAIDAGPSCEAGVRLCGARCVDPSLRNVDQSQLDSAGYISLLPNQRPGESFTVGVAGTLTGIEVGVGACNNTDTSGQVQLELFDGNGTSLGTTTVAESMLPTSCGGLGVTAGSIGAGYFDLTALCVSVSPGDQFTFVFSLIGVAPATCSHDTRTCSNSASYCEQDEDCGQQFAVGATNCGGYGCSTSSSRYMGGNEVIQNVSTAQINQEPDFELAFKTFVQ